MLNALFHRAQATVDNAIGQAVNRALIVLPFLVALGFATAAATSRLVRELGPELGYLAIAGGYAVIGLFVAALVMARSQPQTDQPSAAGAAADEQAASSTASQVSDADRELITAALTTAAPVALPALITALLRNLPIVVALASLLYIFIRPGKTNDVGQTSSA